ncbi:hypothetical protein E1B28_011222 [Marasmius oreades]|uniref:Cytoplasmic tRNA 2-thiolation protein 2 n=1 Tax=Marasmius oreades TaxID=181124 RepID=A0A9P7RTP3_9AGAR|nr:uncharacterized protein E1B28_011222 [Marasmius oreades]KAG7089549.1 hypothetical protein E1B28_011222 [Marasmius oreades]
MSESCGNPSSQTDALMDRRPKFDRNKLCIKCKTNTGNVVIRHAVYCKECFPSMVVVKVKRSLDPYINATSDVPRRKALRASGNLLIAFSGGLGSTVALDLISKIYFPDAQNKLNGEHPRGGKSHPRNKRVWDKGTACYVEICNAFPGMEDKTAEIRDVVESYRYLEFTPLRLEDAFDKQWWKKVGGNPGRDIGIDLNNEELLISELSSEDSNPVQRLRSYISALPTLTAVHSAIQNLIRLLLLHTARVSESSHLLLGTNLTSLSISLISSISQGGGFAVKEESFEEWSTGWTKDGASTPAVIRVNRPLQDVTLKECAVWVWWNNLRVVGRDRSLGGRQGIGALTRDFIVGLERDYPSTVSAIARTCSKLAPKFLADGTCALCQRPLQRGIQEWKARISIRTIADDQEPSRNTSAETSLAPYLCYACHTTLTSRSSRSAPTSTSTFPLPLWVHSHLRPGCDAQIDGNGRDEVGMNSLANDSEAWERRKVDREGMKSAISDFLLE